MKNIHKGVVPFYNTGIFVFFTIAVVFVILLVNIGFSVNDAQKDVVEDAYDEVRDQLEVSGKISAVADVSTNEIMITAIPVRVSNNGIVNLNPQTAEVGFNIIKQSNLIAEHKNIYADRIVDRTFNSLRDALEEAEDKGIIDTNPIVTKQAPTKSTAFIYWVLNQNFDHFLDNEELAVVAIVYAESERPSSGDKLFIEVNVPEGFVLRIDQEVPSISTEVLNFGGKIE